MHHFYHARDDRDSGATPPLIFLPGWGFDATILSLAPDFAKLPLPWILPAGPIDPYTVVQDLKNFLEQHRIARVALIGWSMGAYAALDFARRFPDQTERLILLATREHWPAEEINPMREALTDQPEECLRGFYRRCFLGNREAYREFRDRFEPRYLETMDPASLRKGLDFLAEAAAPHPIRPGRTMTIHGSRDVIAPAREIMRLTGARQLVVDQAGHAVFLTPEFWQELKPRKKITIKERFSAAATTYDQHANIQRSTAQMLVQSIPEDFEAQNILEIGCGTGHYTGLLAERWPDAHILALDFSPEMLEQSKRHLAGIDQVSLVCADAEQFLADSDRKFDLITSNACLQWFNAPEEAYGHIARLLAPGGLLACSLFGPRSLEELSKALETEMGHEFPLAAGFFSDLATIRGWLELHFRATEYTEMVLPREYASFLELLTHLKRTGTTGAHTPPVFTRARLRRLDRWFKENFGGCHVSYQIFIIRAQKR